MKNSILIALFLMAVPAHAHSSGSPTASLSLFDYAVYAKDSIHAECGDFQGRTAAAGAINLRDFSIVLADNQTGCPLESASPITTLNGAILTGVDASCVGARQYSSQDTEYSFRTLPVSPFSDLSQQMDTLSATLEAPMINSNVTQITVNMAQVKANGEFNLSGSANTLLVVNILDTNVSIFNLGITLSGGLTPQNIIWNFPNATSLFIAYSGMAIYGMPGTFVAPNAAVTFNNARITGALFAKSILGKADHQDCSGVVSGQVNGSCLMDIVSGIGCSCTCQTPAPGPGQQQKPEPQQF
jgi:choice-of-anchor A domain-containing protein